ncbi:hypothetical protein GFY24_17385 [Nocardia sp. SYP-A9097]|uniref:hypothetical protein n=1 Tax=Nocardia sp. SYP-A9097 TaxID=2663237 RepID=UPI00129B3CA7|nr:hypothetical protein [Nocardia sp. SYP-A9097]MRH89201.1 hypothetical protein [Nocardia sp. SYP-A9097]
MINTGTAEAWPGVNWCSFSFTYSYPTVLPPSIESYGKASCTTPPSEHVGTLALEYQDGGQWMVGSISNPYTDIPNPEVDYKVSAACYNGTWRMTVRIRGTDSKGPFSYDEHSDTKTVTTCENRR